MKNKIIKNLKASLPKIKHIQDLNSLENKIIYEFKKERDKRNKRKIKLFKSGDKVLFLPPNRGFAQNGVVEKILRKMIKVKSDEDGWIFTCAPSRMGFRK